MKKYPPYSLEAFKTTAGKGENYITDIKIIGDEYEEVNISERNKSVEDIMNNSEEIDDQMSNIIDDINYSRYEDLEVNET